MEITLAIGDRSYSSWSLRGWLSCVAFGITPAIRHAQLWTPDFDALRAEFAPSRSVPAMRIGRQVIWDSFAIAETLAERFPQAGHWPADPAWRGVARSVVAEMHSGFAALRRDCPMNLLTAWEGFVPSPAVLADLDRVLALWAHARRISGAGSGWLFGAYSLADAFFAPVAARIAGFGLPVEEVDADYVALHLAEPNFRRWRAMGIAEGTRQPRYHLDLAERPWPGPAPLPARPLQGASPVNAHCPYSGKPVTPDALAEIDGRVIGFCNTFCRDKTVADPEAWPAAMALLRD